MGHDAHGPLPAFAMPFAWIAARAYGVGVGVRNARLDRGRGVRRLEVNGARIPVISVGNLTAGGTGKSPFVAWVCAALEHAGARPVIAMRGYASSGDGSRSDEAMEYATTAPNAMLVVHPRRHAALTRALSDAELRRNAIVVLDDGFQHRQLARELDIVLVDASRPGLDGDLLPNGWLREPARNIARADIVVLTKAHDPEQRARASRLVEQVRGRGPDAVCDHAWRELAVHGVPVSQDGVRREPVAWLSGRTVVSACALGNPAHFRSMVARAGAVVAAVAEKGDHQALSADELDAAASRARAEAIVMSRKDWVKLDRAPKATVVVPELAIDFVEGEARVRAAISAAAARKSAS